MFHGLMMCDGFECRAGAGSTRAVCLGAFDSPAETAADALEAMRALGWAILDDGTTVCPACVARAAPPLPPGESMGRMVAIVKPGAADEPPPSLYTYRGVTQGYLMHQLKEMLGTHGVAPALTAAAHEVCRLHAQHAQAQAQLVEVHKALKSARAACRRLKGERK